MKPELTEQTKTLVDALSIVTVIGALIQALPAFAALFTIIWTAIRIWETDTVRGLTGRSKPAKTDAVQE